MPGPPLGWRGRLLRPGVLLGLGAALAAALGLLGWSVHSARQRPGVHEFKRLTFLRGAITGARFAPDGGTLYYSASVGGEPVRVFSQGEGALGVMVPGLPPAHLLAVSASGELALQQSRRIPYSGLRPGTLLLVRPGVGALRPVAEGVTAADFAPDGKGLAIAFRDEKQMECRLEYPQGTVLHRGGGWITHLRVSPDGQRVAFRVANNTSGSGGALWLARAGEKEAGKVLLAGRVILQGVVWEPSGRGVLTRTGDWIEEVDLQGRLTRRVQFPGGTRRLYDRDGRGRLLLGLVDDRGTTEFIDAKGRRRDLSWMDFTYITGVSEDGASILFHETGVSGQFQGGPAAFLRPTTGEPPVQLGQGNSLALSPDGRFALLRSQAAGSKVILQPAAGPGAPQELEPAQAGAAITAAFFAPDGRVCWTERDGQGGIRNWIATPGRPPQPLGPEGYRVISVAPDQHRLILSKHGAHFVAEAGGGPPRELPQVRADHSVAGWLGPGVLLLHAIEPGRCLVERLDLATGRLSPFTDLTPADRNGLVGSAIYACQGGRAWAVTYLWYNVDLYLAVPDP